MSTTSTTWPSDVSPPLTTDNDHNHSGLVVVITALAAIVQIIIVFCEVHYGWGTPIDDIESTRKEQMLKIVYAADIFSIVVLGLSKMTSCMFYEGLFSQVQRRIPYVILRVMIVWTIISVLLLGIRCSSKPWSDISAAECSGLVWLAPAAEE
ncbi:hypothetical protein PENVUL_c052G00070 [Penicillium vulpinum]|uniref:Rhodopsin domain-containing protein n=1 Tax=Penicillium vulpinum TaxID=29845 RepID=A0A1V6RFK8_9EURO|nr:hypothetical protein PENVUL_c052G00070 [Penicillium vulpinum]